jgi:hypothetical protein
MRRWSIRQVFISLLAVFLAAGTSLSYVQASDMMAKMTMMSEMGASMHNDCKSCVPSAPGAAKGTSCITGCVAPVLAVLPQAGAIAVGEATVSFAMVHSLRQGMKTPPDPSPPRSTDIV